MNTGLPVQGYVPQSDEKVALVNEHKQMEERILRRIDELSRQKKPATAGDDVVWASTYSQRWLAVARTHFEEGFMALNRAVFQPKRIKLPEDEA